ncbi:uncharacterized protein UV8b_04909 [Ustilaginoidea virens]|uniref:Hamartin n=1 Tax=Ustilaginoidea virens TaxID=1159556 RepID=A0A8E5HSG2_USTVR|nr:uncharacterized protein UV8b_04909 [Ustilaginoidea virens]QUC20668.1 hypothetical protein UV8b_04909 [Ustilaginoidea virens]
MMASPISLKDLLKAINGFLGDPSLPLPDSLVEAIAAFSRRREEHDDAAADQLQESLVALFQKRIKDDSVTAGPWIAILRRLIPVLQTPQRIMPWFDAFRGLLDGLDLDQKVADETVAALMDMVTHMDVLQTTCAGGPSAASLIIDRLFEVWATRFYVALVGGDRCFENNERLIRRGLCNFGKKHPTELVGVIDSYLVKKAYRKSALRILCDFIQGQPPHLHQVLNTSFFANLLTCLQQDTSTTVISAALTALIMLLPHMPSSLVPHLPALFNIYGRLLFWDRERSRPALRPDSDAGGTEPAPGWELAIFDPDVDDLIVPRLGNYYTILYGLYPINFMDYIRKPQRYMRHANAADADQLEVQPTEMRHRSETFGRNHLLHPNFYSLTIDSEKTDLGRWIKSEAAEVVAECMGLCLETDMRHFADPSAAPLPGTAMADHAAANLDSHVFNEPTGNDAPSSGPDGQYDSWRNLHPTASGPEPSNPTPTTMVRRRSSQSSIPSRRGSAGDGRSRVMTGIDSPTLTTSLSHPQLQDLIQSNKAIKSGLLHQSLANDSVPSLALSHQDSAAEQAAPVCASCTMPPAQLSSESPSAMSEMPSQVSNLQKQILILQNDLSFERYLKQQHMAHIGDLRRKQMAEAATEAETQNLIMMNRNLKSRFEEAKKSEMQAKKESEKSRAMAKKWEADLANKFKALREESKRTHADLEALQKELQERKQECEKLRKLLCDAEVKELTLQQNMQSLAMDGTQVESLKAEVERLRRSERDHQARELERQSAIHSAAEVENQVAGLEMKLAALDYDAARTKKLFQSQIEALQAQLSEARDERERPGANANIAVEDALAASRAKQAELQKQYSLLMRKYTVLQSSLLDMQSEQMADSKPSRPPGSPPQQQRPSSSDGEHPSSLPSSPVVVKSQPHKALSNAQATGHHQHHHHTACSVGSQSGGSVTSGALAQVSSKSRQGGEGPGSTPNPTAPDQRHLGGFQRLRREPRDKNKDDGSGVSGKAKKEKKCSGLKGIRGFV